MTNGGRHYPEGPDPTLLQPELVGVPLVKGPGGFGFAIADCPLGQKVPFISGLLVLFYVWKNEFRQHFTIAALRYAGLL